MMELAWPLQDTRPPVSWPVRHKCRQSSPMPFSIKWKATGVCQDLGFDSWTLYLCRRQQRLLPSRNLSPKKRGLKKAFLTRSPQDCSHSLTLTQPV